MKEVTPSEQAAPTPLGANHRGMITDTKMRRIGFVGVRTDRVAETTAFFRGVVGLPAVSTREDWTVTQLPTGPWDFVEVFGSDFGDARLMRSEASGVVVAFFVEDLEEARRDCEAAGVEMLGDTVWADASFDEPSHAGVGWFFVRAPDGNVYVFQQAPDSR